MEKYNEYYDYIKKFEKNNKNFINKISFYREILDNQNKKMTCDEYYNLSNIMLENLDIKNIISYDHYMLVIDIMMITAINCDDYNKNYSNLMFEKAIKFGEENDNYSYQNFYDALNCAYTWMGTIKYAKKEYKEALILFNKVIANYNKVKDNPNYNIREKDSVPISRNYIEIINKTFS